MFFLNLFLLSFVLKYLKHHAVRSPQDDRVERICGPGFSPMGRTLTEEEKEALVAELLKS